MKSFRADQMRELDRLTIEAGCPGETLMERAGRGVALAVEDMAARCARAPRVLLFAGSGNNGGDAFVCARLLAARGKNCVVCLTAAESALKGDAAAQYARMREAGVPVTTPDGVGASCPPGGSLLIVDGILGTGLTGPVRGAAAAAIRTLNALGADAGVVAIDLPSGLDSDTGEPLGETVRADLTVTMGYPKRGLLMPAALEYVGSLRVVDIGISDACAAGFESDLHLVAPGDFERVTRKRPRGAHKGTMGHVLIAGGSPGLTGAVSLAARAALRSGVGLVSVLTPAPQAPIVAGLVPEAMVHGGVCDNDGMLAADAIERWGRSLADFSAVLVGPGLGLNRQTKAFCERVLAGCRAPLVLDADALNALAHRMYLIKRAACPVLLTPHPGEMGRLLGIDARDVQKDRLEVAARAAAASSATVVLKGSGSIVARAGAPAAVNLTGNPGMASGGMGDALAGLLAGLVAQGHEIGEAAQAAVYLHGLAGDLAAAAGAEPSLTASDLIDALPRAWREVAAFNGGCRRA